MAKTLVAYFSATGTTMNVASRLARATDSDLFAIAPADPYANADLDWYDKQSRSTLEAADPSCRPTISSRVEHIENYDTIFWDSPSGGTWRLRLSIHSLSLTTWQAKQSSCLPPRAEAEWARRRRYSEHAHRMQKSLTAASSTTQAIPNSRTSRQGTSNAARTNK